MSLQKVHNIIKERRVRSGGQKTENKLRQGELELTFESRCVVAEREPQELVHGFLSDLRKMCQLIEEAGRYGASNTMEHKYRSLRTSLSNGYRLVKENSGVDLFPSAGFHGSSFETMFSSYSLDALVRGPGLRTVERLAEIWRTAHSVTMSDRSDSHRRA